MAARALACALVLASGCSATFDDGPAYLPLVGAPQSPDGRQTIHKLGFQAMQLVTGDDGVTWAALYEPSDTGIVGPVRVIRLADPVDASSDLIYTDPVAPSLAMVGKHAIYFGGDVPLQVVQPGQPIRAEGVLTPGFPGSIVPADSDHAFLYLPSSEAEPAFAVIRSDGSYLRLLPLVPPEFNSLARAPMISPDGNWVFTFAPDGGITAHLSSAELDLPLGRWAPVQNGEVGVGELMADDRRQQLVRCDDQGVVAMPYDGSPARVLDPAICQQAPPGVDEANLPQLAGDQLVYWSFDGARAVPLDGSGPPRKVAPSGARVLGWGSSWAGGVAYSLTARTDFVGEAGEGFVGAWRFMERGGAVAFDRFAGGLRWIEHTADDAESGDLSSAPVGGAIARLQRSVSQFDQLDDGRVVAESNRAYENAYNRIIVADEAAGIARWVAQDVRRYTLIPGSRDVLAELISENDEKLLVRFSIPPKDAP